MKCAVWEHYGQQSIVYNLSAKDLHQLRQRNVAVVTKRPGGLITAVTVFTVQKPKYKEGDLQQ